MKNAKTDPMPGRLMCLYGSPGTGKTTQINTLPRPTCALFLDPAGKMSIKGHDINYMEFLPDEVNLNPGAIATAAQTRVKEGAEKVPMPTQFLRFRNFLQDFIRSGEIKEYKSIALDGVTSLTDAAMDYEIWSANRTIGVPQRDDYGPVMSLVYRQLLRLVGACDGQHLLVIGHSHDKEKMAGGKGTGIFRLGIAMIGTSREWGPRLFNDLYQTEITKDRDNNVQYKLRTLWEPRMAPGAIKTTKLVHGETDDKGLVDITIHDWDHPEEYGLGRLLRKLDSAPEEEPTSS